MKKVFYDGNCPIMKSGYKKLNKNKSIGITYMQNKTQK